MGFFARRERRATRAANRGTVTVRFFEVLAAGDLARFGEAIEWTIVDVCDMVEAAEIVLVLRERWEYTGTASLCR